MYIKVFIVRLQPFVAVTAWICGKDGLFVSTVRVEGENMRLEDPLKEIQMGSSH